MSENQAVVCRFQTSIQITAAKEDSQNLADSFTGVLTRKKGVFCHLYIFFTVVSQVALLHRRPSKSKSQQCFLVTAHLTSGDFWDFWVLLHEYSNSHETAALLYNTIHLLLNCSCCWKSVLVLILSSVQEVPGNAYSQILAAVQLSTKVACFPCSAIVICICPLQVHILLNFVLLTDSFKNLHTSWRECTF